MPPLRLALLLCLLACCACSGTSMPLLTALDVMNVAETGKTGFDMVAGLSTRRSLPLDESPDAQAEARLRAALEAQGGLLARATPHVCQGRGYVVGTYADRQELERARQATRNIKGLSEVTLCLLPKGSRPPLPLSDAQLRENILRLSGARPREVRVQVVEGTAVLMGSVRTRAEQERLHESAQSSGAAGVRNYVRLLAAN